MKGQRSGDINNVEITTKSYRNVVINKEVQL